MTPGRRSHAARVAELLSRWAEELGLGGLEVVRWRAAGWLHDALRDADPGELRALVQPELRTLPDPILHGPATAARLAAEGVDDPPLLLAISYHTLGHPGWGRLGRALYAADYLEPGRTFDPAGRAVLRARLPESLDDAVREVAAERIRHLLDLRRPIHPLTAAFWNAILPHRHPDGADVEPPADKPVVEEA